MIILHLYQLVGKRVDSSLLDLDSAWQFLQEQDLDYIMPQTSADLGHLMEYGFHLAKILLVPVCHVGHGIWDHHLLSLNASMQSLIEDGSVKV